MKLLKVIFAGLLAVVSSLDAVCANEIEYNDIMSSKEYQKLIDYYVAPVKKPEDLELISNNISALDLLSEQAKASFVESIEFNEKGITSFSMAELESELTPTQIYQVLALLGYQHQVYKFKNARVETTLDALLLSKAKYNRLIVKHKNNQSHIMMPQGYGDFLEGYRCETRATCAQMSRRACTSNC